MKVIPVGVYNAQPSEFGRSPLCPSLPSLSPSPSPATSASADEHVYTKEDFDQESSLGVHPAYRKTEAEFDRFMASLSSSEFYSWSDER